MRIVGNNPQLSRQTQGTASGAITGGLPVVVNTDGTVSEISETAQALGSATVFESAFAHTMDSTFDSNVNRVIIVYVDNANSRYGTAVVGTISEKKVALGLHVVFESAAAT